MHRFYVHINEVDEMIIDTEGMEFPDVTTAEDAARLSILEMAMEALKGDTPFATISLQICDNSGNVVSEIFAEGVLRDILSRHDAAE